MKTILASVMVLALASCSTDKAADVAVAESSKAATPAQDMLKVSREGFDAMRAIRAARIAIFNGQPKLATEMLVKAKTDLDAAAKDTTTYVIDAKAIVDGKVVEDDAVTMKKNWIPIDGQIALADTFVPTPENAEHIKKANEHFKMSRSKEALEELRLGEIEVTFSRILMPLDGTMEKVAEATRLAGEHKYYEANLAMKAAEDGLNVDSVSLIEVPKAKNDKKAK